MRLFISVDLDGLADEIAEIRTPLEELSGLRVTDPTDAHVTMKFLGEGDHDLDALSEAIGKVIENTAVGRFKVTLEGTGAFPSPEYIRVIWLGVGDGTEALAKLHRELEAETAALGYEAERHEFIPHVTLARMEHADKKTDVQEFINVRDPKTGPISVEALRLKESTLSADGPEYRTIETFEL